MAGFREEACPGPGSRRMGGIWLGGRVFQRTINGLNWELGWGYGWGRPLAIDYENAFIPRGFRLQTQRSPRPVIWSEEWLGSAELGLRVCV